MGCKGAMKRNWRAVGSLTVRLTFWAFCKCWTVKSPLSPQASSTFSWCTLNSLVLWLGKQTELWHEAGRDNHPSVVLNGYKNGYSTRTGLKKINRKQRKWIEYDLANGTSMEWLCVNFFQWRREGVKKTGRKSLGARERTQHTGIHEWEASALIPISSLLL